MNLLAWLVVPALLILGVSAWLSYGSAMRLATLVTDRQLLSSARMIAEQLEYSDGQLSAVIPPAALELFATDSHDEVAYAVIGANGVLVAGYPGLNAPDEKSPGPQYYATMFRIESMRAVRMTQPVTTPAGTVEATIMVGETLKARDDLVRSLWVRGFLEQALLVAAGAVSIWIGITRQLRPLLRLRQQVRDRPADQFEPFDSDAVQTEVRPMVLALNSHMARLRTQLERQRHFLESAAHQLRTPLAIMKTQVGYAIRSREDAEVDLALKEVDGNLSEMARMTDQLLVLGSVEHKRIERAELVDMDRAVKQSVMSAAGRALDEGIELAYDSDGPSAVVGSEVLIHELVANLIDNVILHAGRGAVATVAVRRAVSEIIVRVEDNGVGVAPEDRPALLERFHRGRNARAGGSGLGLSIVAEIAEALGGSVTLPPPHGERGFSVVV
ncbi:MAG: sensor histidine kinase N-terminal domain-containing protein, partial [Devosia sp.]